MKAFARVSDVMKSMFNDGIGGVSSQTALANINNIINNINK